MASVIDLQLPAARDYIILISVLQLRYGSLEILAVTFPQFS
jgi:hypothetical protein